MTNSNLLKNMIKLGIWDGEMILNYTGGPLMPYPYKRDCERLYTEEKWCEEGTDRDLKALALKSRIICSHKPRNAGNQQKLEEEEADVPPQP